MKISMKYLTHKSISYRLKIFYIVVLYSNKQCIEIFLNNMFKFFQFSFGTLHCTFYIPHNVG